MALSRQLLSAASARALRRNKRPIPIIPFPIIPFIIAGASGRTIVSVGREEADVGEAREVMDRVTDAILKGDSEALKALYAQDAVAETPDQGTITGRDQIAAYLGEFARRFRITRGRSGTSTRPATRRSTRDTSLGRTPAQ